MKRQVFYDYSNKSVESFESWSNDLPAERTIEFQNDGSQPMLIAGNASFPVSHLEIIGIVTAIERQNSIEKSRNTKLIEQFLQVASLIVGSSGLIGILILLSRTKKE